MSTLCATASTSVRDRRLCLAYLYTFCAWCTVTDMSSALLCTDLSLPAVYMSRSCSLCLLFNSHAFFDLQLLIHNQGCGEQHGFWAGPPCECGAVCPSGQQMGGELLPSSSNHVL